MSLTRRLAAGLPAAGVTAFAALAFAAAPASAAAAAPLSAAAAAPLSAAAAAAGIAAAAAPASAATPHPGDGAGPAAVTASPCASRSNCTYGAVGASVTPSGTFPTSPPPSTSDQGGTAAGHTSHGGRGKPAGYGYGGVSPSTAPTPSTPTGGANTVPPTTVPPTGGANTVPPGGGVSPTTAAPAPSESTPGGGVGAGNNLPVTGASAGVTVGLGALLVAAGAMTVWYTRRRRRA